MWWGWLSLIFISAFVAVAIVASSPNGRAFLISTAIEHIGRSFNQDIAFTQNMSSSFSRIDLSDVSIADSQGVWLTIDELKVQLRLSSFLRGHIQFDFIDMNVVELSRFPEIPSQSDAQRQFSLPTSGQLYESLQAMELETGSVNSLRLGTAILGRPTDIGIQASLTTGDNAQTIDARLELVDNIEPNSALVLLRASSRDINFQASGQAAGFSAQGAISADESGALSGRARLACETQPCITWQGGGIDDGNVSLAFAGTYAKPVVDAQFTLTELIEGKRTLAQIHGVMNLTYLASEIGIIAVKSRGRIDGVVSAIPEISAYASDSGEWSLEAIVRDDAIDVTGATLTSGDVSVDISSVVRPTVLSSLLAEISIQDGGRLLGLDDPQSVFKAKFDSDNVGGLDDFQGHIEISLEGIDSISPQVDEVIRATANVVSDRETIVIRDLKAFFSGLRFQGDSTWGKSPAGLDHSSTRVSIETSREDFSSIFPESVEGELNVDGSLSALVIGFAVHAPRVLQGQASVADISLSGTARGNVEDRRVSGEWTGTGQLFGDDELSAASQFILTDTGGSLNAIRFSSNAFEMDGGLEFDFDGYATGDVSGRFSALEPLGRAIGIEAYGDADFEALVGTSAGRVSVTANLQSNAISVPGVSATFLTAQATVDDVLGAANFDVQIEAQAAQFAGRVANAFTARSNGTFDRFSVEVATSGKEFSSLNLDMAADVLLSEGAEVSIRRFITSDGVYKAELLDSTRLVVSENRWFLEPTSLNFAEGTVEASYDWNRADGTISADLTATDMSTDILMGEPRDFTSGVMDVHVSLSGLDESADIELVASGEFPPPTDSDADPIQMELVLNAHDGFAVASGTASGFPGDPAQLTAQFPLTLDVRNRRLEADVDAPVSGALNWSGNLASVLRLFPIDDHILDGAAQLDVAVTGSLADPQFTGGVRVAEGTYDYLPGGTTIRNLTADIFAQSADDFSFSLSATDVRNGTLNASGAIYQNDESASWIADISADVDRLGFVNRDDVTASATGALSYKGPVRSGTLGGELRVVRSTARLDASYRPDVPLLRSPSARGLQDAQGDSSPIKLNLGLEINDLLRVEGRGLESLWRGQLRVEGDILRPRLVGAMVLDRGTFTFLGQTFVLNSGRVNFTGGRSIDPELAVTAERQTEDISAIVSITGRASKPTITLSSRPPLPQDEVLSRLLFRKGSGQLGPLESVQLASAVTELSGLSDGGFNGVLRRTFGLDVVSVGGEDGDSLVVGEQIGRNIYVAVEQNLTDNSRKFVVEWRFLPSVSLKSTASDETGADLGILWRRDY